MVVRDVFLLPTGPLLLDHLHRTAVTGRHHPEASCGVNNTTMGRVASMLLLVSIMASVAPLKAEFDR